ncbi:hypothetical protein FRC17_004501 [Serendipita sp. 399]|nr:hypothetical protein FRC17_004501 [Serendipita sp. 399]
MSMSVVGVNKTSFCRFKFLRTFFERGYRVGQPAATGRQRGETRSNNREDENESDVEEISQVVGVIQGKPFLAVLRGSGTDKSAGRCHLEFLEGVESSLQTSDEDSMETRMMVKLFYKHGITRTHIFAIAEPTSTAAPALPTDDELSSIQIGGRTLKELTEHFPRPERKNPAVREPLLIWQFHDDRTILKTEDRWSSSRGDWIGTSKGKKSGKTVDPDDDDGTLIYSSLNSQITLSDTEFDIYEVKNAPVTLAIHLKELNATMAAAEGLGADILVRFTSQGEPIYFSIESSSGTYSSFCALSTRVVPEGKNDGARSQRGTQRGFTVHPVTNMVARKRQREDGDERITTTVTRRRVDTEEQQPSFANVITSTPRARQNGPQPSAHLSRASGRDEEEPLFLPTDSPPPSQILQAAGLGDLEKLTQEELQAIFEDDMEMEVEGGGVTNDEGHATDDTMAHSTVGEEAGYSGNSYPATQSTEDSDFRPLFED